MTIDKGTNDAAADGEGVRGQAEGQPSDAGGPEAGADMGAERGAAGNPGTERRAIAEPGGGRGPVAEPGGERGPVAEPGGERGPAAIAFRLDPGSGVPTYLQLVQQVEHALRLGYLGVGDRLPTVKEVVSSLAINPNTVLKAYRELEHRGMAAGRPGQGTFIRGTPATAGLAELAALRKSLLAWLRTADASGLDEAGMVALFTSALRDFEGERGAVPPERRRHDRRGEAPGPRDVARTEPTPGPGTHAEGVA